MVSEEEISDYSDLTSLASDSDSGSDESDVEFNAKRKSTSKGKSGKGMGRGAGKGKAKVKAGEKGYKIRNALKVPRATTYTAQALFAQMHDSEIDLEAEYQRDVVWTEPKQIGLIDSIFRNFYIPPVIFAVKAYDDGSERKICIDGKQRLTSIQMFMNGQIPHRDPFTNEKLWYTKPTDERMKKSYKLLPVKYQKLFANKQIVCVEYQDITEGDEREIFQRVQLGMALTPAEKLQVTKTARSDFIRSLLNKYIKSDSFSSTPLNGESLNWDTARGADFRAISFAVCCMDRMYRRSGARGGNGIGSTRGGGGFSPPSGIAVIDKWLNIVEPLEKDLVEDIEHSFHVFSQMAEHPVHRKVFTDLPGVKVLSPVEFIFIAVFIFVHKDTVVSKSKGNAKGGLREENLRELIKGIKRMREEVRETHVDIRQNGRVMKTLGDYVLKWRPSASEGDKTNTNTMETKAATPTTTLKRKRKGVEEFPESGEELDDDALESEEGMGMDVDDDGGSGDYGSKVKKPKMEQLMAWKTAKVVRKSTGGGGDPVTAPRTIGTSTTTQSPRIKPESSPPPQPLLVPTPIGRHNVPPPTSSASASGSGSTVMNSQISGPSSTSAQTPSTAATTTTPAAYTDRMAAIRRAKESSSSSPASTAQQQLAATGTPNPQMLPSPSPGQTFAVPTQTQAQAHSVQQALMQQTVPTASQGQGPPASQGGGRALPPPPLPRGGKR